MKLVRIKYGDDYFYAIQKGWWLKRYYCEHDNSWPWRRKLVVKYCLYTNIAPARRTFNRLTEFQVETVTDLEKELK